MQKVVALVVIVAGCLAVWVGLREARTRQESGPEPVVTSFLQAFLAGDQSTMRRLADPDGEMSFPADEVSAIEGVKFRVRSTVVDGQFATSKFTLVADKDFVRGEVFTVLRQSQWYVQGVSLNNSARERDKVDDLELLNDLPGVTVESL